MSPSRPANVRSAQSAAIASPIHSANAGVAGPAMVPGSDADCNPLGAPGHTTAGSVAGLPEDQSDMATEVGRAQPVKPLLRIGLADAALERLGVSLSSRGQRSHKRCLDDMRGARGWSPHDVRSAHVGCNFARRRVDVPFQQQKLIWSGISAGWP